MQKIKPQSPSRVLFIKKLRHVNRWIKRKYGLRTLPQISRFVGEHPKFINNMLYVAQSRYLQGPPLFRFYKFCRAFGLKLEYFANYDIPVNSNFLEDAEPNLFTLQTRFKATEDIKYLHMAAGYVAGAISKISNLKTVFVGRRILLTLYGDPQPGCTFVVFADNNNRFKMAHTYDDLGKLSGEVILTEAYLTSLCERLEQQKNVKT